MKKAAMPTSKAKTAYGLLTDIARLALAEPRRIRMAWWLTRPEDVEEAKRPACGTIGCIGGWAILLKGTKKQVEAAYRDSFPFSNTADVSAMKILGLKEAQGNQLFNSFVHGNAGTLTHARAVAARIRAFQKQYAAQLKATRV